MNGCPQHLWGKKKHRLGGRCFFCSAMDQDLLFVDYFDEFAVGFEGDGLHVGFFLPEEEAGFAIDAHLVGHLALDVADVDFADFVLGKLVGEGVLNGVGIVLLIDVVASFGSFVGEADSLFVAIGRGEGGHIGCAVFGHDPGDVLCFFGLILEVFNVADGHVGLFYGFVFLGKNNRLAHKNEC